MYCDHQGYKGRSAIMEVLKFDTDLNELITRGATLRDMTNLQVSRGFRPLAEAGVGRVLDGVTSLDEISRVVDLTERLN